MNITKDSMMLCFVSTDRYKIGSFSLRRNVTTKPKHVAGPTSHKVEYLEHHELGARKNKGTCPRLWSYIGCICRRLEISDKSLPFRMRTSWPVCIYVFSTLSRKTLLIIWTWKYIHKFCFLKTISCLKSKEETLYLKTIHKSLKNEKMFENLNIVADVSNNSKNILSKCEK